MSRGESLIGRKPQRGKKLAMIVIGSAVAIGIAGGIGAYLSSRGGGKAPMAAAQMIPADEKTKLERELLETKDALAAEKKQADELRAEKKKAADKAAEAARQQEKLAAAVGGQGAVSSQGEEITLELVDKVLFQVGEAELTPRGKDVLTRVGAALNDVPDKQIWVQGHTDDTPIRPAKGVVPKFATNWELSSARALTVVHYLQTEAKVDPRRLAAVAFGEYRPASRNKAKNRRIEIVLYPRHQLAK